MADEADVPQRVATALIHHPYQPPPGFTSIQPAVHKASTVVFADTAALRNRSWKDKSGYSYGLHGTPTTYILEERIATTEGGLQSLLVPSGLAAITLVDLSLLAAGDEVLIPDNAYGPGKELARAELARWGITHRFYDAMNPQSLAEALSPATPPGVARGCRLGDDGVPRSGGPGKAGARARRDDGARQHLGRWRGLRSL